MLRLTKITKKPTYDNDKTPAPPPFERSSFQPLRFWISFVHPSLMAAAEGRMERRWKEPPDYCSQAPPPLINKTLRPPSDQEGEIFLHRTWSVCYPGAIWPHCDRAARILNLHSCSWFGLGSPEDPEVLLTQQKLTVSDLFRFFLIVVLSGWKPELKLLCKCQKF